MTPLRITGSGGKSYTMSGGNARPNGLIIGSVGDLFVVELSSAGELWQKASGYNTNTGWVEKGGGQPSGVQVPIKFTATASNTYTAATVPDLVRLAGLAKANIDLMAQDGGNVMLSLYGWNGTTLTINTLSGDGGEEIALFFHT